MAQRVGAEFGWRALVGWIHSYGMLHSTPLDLYRIVPDGYGFLFTTLGKKDQSAEETDAALGRLLETAQLLAANGAEFFCINSSPMVTHGGPGADLRLIASIREATGRPGTTTTTAAMRAMRAMGITKIAMCSPYQARNAKLIAFLEANGFEVVGSYGMTEELTHIHRLPGEVAYRVGREAFRAAPGAQALYMAGGRLRAIDVIEELETDLKVPVIASTPAIVWEVLHYFGTTTPIDGFGRLLSEFPALAEGDRQH
ncbi:aspartate/glutamate racemase family protein [Micromonospora sp. 4G57]|uniref:Aspartate/glutamate racemase family protein n=1 Tax=Micromonospora sicca TaxID=2202420 RepID=A0ABU5JE94_9ACTN|nr:MULTISPECIES: aspartate/glutamate racemase family protein [unclassified Micromonospora]MDZ5445081.1 aspartate/glutamate racemase family protein [Micromonospora sp. 4G57]MDZ5490799.1 aspartate/glutamate racemase family protein [Micromonospora sp. 4G53]